SGSARDAASCCSTRPRTAPAAGARWRTAARRTKCAATSLAGPRLDVSRTEGSVTGAGDQTAPERPASSRATRTRPKSALISDEPMHPERVARLAVVVTPVARLQRFEHLAALGERREPRFERRRLRRAQQR